MRRIVLTILAAVMLADAAQSMACAEVPEALQREALATVRRYAQDMTAVIPCFTMMAPPQLWDKNYGEPEFNAVMERFGQAGASQAQVEALREVFKDSYRPRWFGDIRLMARSCYSSKIIEAIQLLTPPALPLTLRSPFNKQQ
jgi:hypothetical protein